MYLFRGWQAARYCCWAQVCGAIRAPGKILPAGNSLSARYTPSLGIVWRKRSGTDQQYFTRYYRLVYPAHWQPYIAQDLGQQTDIDIYLDRHVVRQGRYLSLHDEVKNFPLQHWLRSTIIAAGSLLVLFMLLFWIRWICR